MKGDAMAERQMDPSDDEREPAPGAGDAEVTEGKTRPGADEPAQKAVHHDWIAERARLQDEMLRAKQEAELARAERGQLLAQLREGNERLVIASVQADELAERADAGRRRAETLAAQLRVSEAAMRASERQLREREEQLRAALVAGRMAHWRCDPETDSVVVSATMNDIYGLPPGMTFRSSTEGYGLIHPEDVAEHRAVVQAAERARQGWQREFRIVRPCDNEIAWLEESATCVVNSVTGRWEIVGLVRDITERKRAEALLREKEQHTRALLSQAVAARAEAEAATRAKDEFLTTVNHELRTPLAAILLWARALGSGLDPAENARAIEAIAQSAQTQSQLIEDLVELSRLTSGGFRLSRSAVELGAVVADVCDMIQPMMVAKAIAFDVRIEPASIVAAMDARRMKQILANILANAAKFTPSGGGVRLLVRARDARIDVELSDTGEGIAADFLPFVFERFSQADMSDTRRHGGLGIGLAIARQLVELHGGTIDAQSAGIGRGALFRIRLPWIKPQPGVAPHAENAAPSSRSLPLTGVRVLLVESDAYTRDAMQWTLSREGASVLPVATAGEALKALQGSGVPDIIISELGLPDISGFELMERVVELSRSQGQPTPPSCALSGHTRPSDKRLAIEAGFDLVLAKPVTPEKLVQAMTDLREVLAAKRGHHAAVIASSGLHRSAAS